MERKLHPSLGVAPRNLLLLCGSELKSFAMQAAKGAVPAVGTRSPCETTGFCESSASELMLHLLKQKFTFKEMGGILYNVSFQMYHQGKEKRKQAAQIIVRKKKSSSC